MPSFQSPKDAALYYMKRSICTVQVGAVLWDKRGFVSAGWNHSGPSGMGEHAEENCLKRASHKRANGAVMWIAGRYKKSKNPVNSSPCAFCWLLLKPCAYVCYRAKDSTWKVRETNLS